MPIARMCVETRKKEKKQTRTPPDPPPPPPKNNSQPKATSFCKIGKVPPGSSLESSAAKVATAPLRPMSKGNKSCPARDNSCWSNEQRWGS